MPPPLIQKRQIICTTNRYDWHNRIYRTCEYTVTVRILLSSVRHPYFFSPGWLSPFCNCLDVTFWTSLRSFVATLRRRFAPSQLRSFGASRRTRAKGPRSSQSFALTTCKCVHTWTSALTLTPRSTVPALGKKNDQSWNE